MASQKESEISRHQGRGSLTKTKKGLGDSEKECSRGQQEEYFSAEDVLNDMEAMLTRAKAKAGKRVACEGSQ